MKKIIIAFSLVLLSLYSCVFFYSEKSGEFPKLSFISADPPTKVSAGRLLVIHVESVERKLSAFLSSEGEIVCATELKISEGEATFTCFVQKSGLCTLQIGWRKWKIQVERPKLWVFLWMAADNDLEAYSYADLLEMTPLFSDYSVIAVRDLESVEEGKVGIILFDQNGNPYELVLEEEIDSASPPVLDSFIREWWVSGEKKMLIVWDHGGAWLCDSLYASPQSKYIAFDDSSSKAMAVRSLADALEGLQSEGYRFDVIGFDACLMGSLEVLYQLRKVADYIIASPEYEPGSGWNYTVFQAPMNSLEDFSKRIVKSYKEFYAGEVSIPVSLVVYDVKRVDDVATQIKSIVESASTQTVYDVASGLRFLDEDGACREPNNLRDSFSLLSFEDNFKDSMNNLVFYYSQLNGGATSASIYMPEVLREPVVEDYKTLDFYMDTGWLDFIEEMFK